jgi:hypothetical protein
MEYRPRLQVPPRLISRTQSLQKTTFPRKEEFKHDQPSLHWFIQECEELNVVGKIAAISSLKEIRNVLSAEHN